MRKLNAAKNTDAAPSARNGCSLRLESTDSMREVEAWETDGGMRKIPVTRHTGGPIMLDSKLKPSFALRELPYEKTALEPVISARTLSFHHGKHHAGYVAKLNELVENTSYAGLPLDEVVRRSVKDASAESIFNNAAQSWNHDFYWRSMRHEGGGAPSNALSRAIERNFGGISRFRETFVRAAADKFGSGWAWLVASRDGILGIVTTDDADTPMVRGLTPLFTIDIWEHAYYLDYQNRRPDYIGAWLDRLIDWEFAERNFAQI
jgi:superoxide dismutase, Fe-Mn family